MHRCLQVARLGAGNVAPNPMVGSVLVHDERIIGEGYHQEYGKAHAEVNCLNSVSEENIHLVPESTLYVSLEPCAHFGKTPPCADLIIEKKIPLVVIGCRDPFERVNGRGIEKLKSAGVELITGVMEKECKELNKRFFTFHAERRPYIILKWAETKDGKIARPPLTSPTGENITQPPLKGDTDRNNGSQKSEESVAGGPSPREGSGMGRLLITNPYTNRIVHKWRSEESAILVGTNTALADDPELTTRLWPGKNPIRLIVDLHSKLPQHLQIFQAAAPTIVFNLHVHDLPFECKSPNLENGTYYYQVTEDVSLVHQIVNALYQLNIQSVIVEGGAFLLQSFIDEGMWDEARVICNEQLTIGSGLPAPVLQHQQIVKTDQFFSDTITFYTRK